MLSHNEVGERTGLGSLELPGHRKKAVGLSSTGSSGGERQGNRAILCVRVANIESQHSQCLREHANF